jgi:hypothetical protein
MFRFAHYVFGTENDQNINNENLFNINDCVQTDVDDDWILIDIPFDDNIDKQNGRNNYKEMQSISANETTTNTVPEKKILDTLDAQQSVDKRESCQSEPNSPTPVQAMMEESWFVTPPPCFNSLSNPIIIETTPFENLLIEHPSMSVFGPSLPPTHHLSLRRDSLSSSSTTLSSPTDTSSNDSIILLTQEQKRQTRRRRQQQNIQNRNNNQNNVNLHMRAVVLDELHVLSSMQNREVAQIQKLMTKSNMDRQNKVVFQRNRPQNRRAKMAMRPNGIFY